MSLQSFVNLVANPRAGLSSVGYEWRQQLGSGVASRSATGGPTAEIPTYAYHNFTASPAGFADIVYATEMPAKLDGTTYSMDGWVWSDAGVAEYAYLFVLFEYTSGVASGTNSYAASPVVVLQPGWNLLSSVFDFAAVLQSSAATVSNVRYGVRVEQFTGLPAFEMRVTGLSMVENAPNAPAYTGGYFDGEFADVDNIDYGWLGVAHASPSAAIIQEVPPLTPFSVARAAPVVEPAPPVAGVTPRTFTPIQLTDYSVVEDSTPVDPSDTTGGVGQFILSVPEETDTISLMEVPIDLTVTSQGETRGTIRGLGSTDQSATVTADSRLSQLNADRQAQPYIGTLGGAFEYYLSLVDMTEDIFIDSTVGSEPVVFPGWNANVWDQIKKMSLAYRAEVSLVSNNVVLRPVRLRTGETYRDISQGWGLDSSQLARAIEIYYYQNEPITNQIVYPDGGWNPDVPILSVGAGETITFPIAMNASLTSVQQPVVQDFVARDYSASSVYSISGGGDGLPIPSAQWTAQGGSVVVEIAEDTRSLNVIVTGASEPEYAPYSIAMSAGPSDRYSSLRIVGTGVRYNKQLITLDTSVDPDRVSAEIGATIDNEFIGTADRAIHSGLWALKRWGSPKYTINVTTSGINRLGDNGSYRYPTVADFNALYAGQDIADFNAEWAGQAIEDFNRYMVSLVQNDFENQAFGNISGARVRFRDAMFRIRTATIGATGITYSAEEDTTIGDFNAAWSGDGPAQRNWVVNPSGRLTLGGYLGTNGSLSVSPGNYTQLVSTGTGAAYTTGITVSSGALGVNYDPSQLYTFSADVEAVSGYDVGIIVTGSGVVGGVQYSTARPAGSGMGRVSVDFETLASGNVSATVTNFSPRAPGDTMRFRDARIGGNSTYYDGNSGFGWVWDGAPDASTSTGPSSGTATIADFNRQWSGERMRDFAVAPLRRDN